MKNPKRRKGIFLISLDCYVVCIVYDREDYICLVYYRYYAHPLFVFSEELDSDNPVAHSKDRVIGKLFDDEMILWVT